MLDFVPNHMAPDHPWVDEHPEYFVQGSESDLARAPQNYCRAQTKNGPLVLAYGRDPYFAGWPDTLQLNYGNPELQQAMIGELERIAGQCDGVRCDMAMLVLPDVFERTWGIRAELFWPKATEAVRRKYPEFWFMAEVYWDLEWTMQQQGFDYTYDKRLYDRLREGHARPVREHFHAGLDYQNKMARFLENHDEPRAAATFPPGVHKAAAVITFLSPGLRFFHQGQFEGRTETDLAPSLSRPGRARRPRTCNSSTIGCSRCCDNRPYARASGSCSSADRPGRELDLGLFPGLRLARCGWRAPAGDRELRSQSEPVLCPAAVRGSRRQSMAAPGSDGRSRLRPRRQRPAESLLPNPKPRPRPRAPRAIPWIRRADSCCSDRQPHPMQCPSPSRRRSSSAMRSLMRRVQAPESLAQSARSGTRFCGSRASSAPTSVNDRPIFCANTMKAIRRSTARG